MYEENRKETVAKKDSQVTMELKQLAENTEQLQQLCNQLYDRLSSVMRTQPGENAREGKPQSELAELPSTIREQRYVVQNATLQLRDILDRLEL